MAGMTVREYLVEHFPKQLLKIIYELEFKECQIWISQVLVFQVQNTKYYWGVSYCGHWKTEQLKCTWNP